MVGLRLGYGWGTVGVRLGYGWVTVGLRLGCGNTVGLRLGYGWGTVGYKPIINGNSVWEQSGQKTSFGKDHLGHSPGTLGALRHIEFENMG